MGLKYLKIILTVCLSMQLFLPQFAMAQAGVGEEVARTSGPRRQLATIIFSGLAGAILGLSTLSFFGCPQDKLSNIAIGFAVGIIVGTSYTTYKTATQPYEYLGEYEMNSRGRNLQASQLTPMLGYNWSF